MRGAMPKIAHQLLNDSTDFGHYLALSSPHLGIQASWFSPKHAWRNVCCFTGLISQQLVQLSISDGDGGSLPYLATLGDAQGKYMQALRRCRSRTCATLVSGDALISLHSGLAAPDLVIEGPGFLDATSWRFECRTGLEPSSSFETAIRGKGHHPCAETLSSSKDLSPAGREVSCKQSGPVTGLSCLLLQHVRALLFGIATAVVARLCRLRGLGGIEGAGSWRCRDRCPGASYQEMPGGSSVEEAEGPKGAIAPPLSSDGGSGWRDWHYSSDGSACFPGKLAVDLDSLPWQRIPVSMNYSDCSPLAKNAHVFLIGKRAEQFEKEHEMSRECIKYLAETLAD